MAELVVLNRTQGLGEKEKQALDFLMESGVLTPTDIDKEFIEREVEYYAEQEMEEETDTDISEIKTEFKKLLQKEFENITDNDYIARLWEQAKDNVLAC